MKTCENCIRKQTCKIYNDFWDSLRLMHDKYMRIMNIPKDEKDSVNVHIANMCGFYKEIE